MALARLMTKYLPLIEMQAAHINTCGLGLEREDLVQEGLLGLFRAIDSFDENGAASFSTYASACISNGISSAVRSAARKKHLPLKGYVSLSEDNADSITAAASPEEIAIASEEHAEIISAINARLSKLERDVLALHLLGYDYLASAEKLDTTAKSVDNALQRARKKLKPKQG